MVILSPSLTEAEVGSLVTEIKGFFAETLFEDLWGKRKFAYPIKKFVDGYYVVWNYHINMEAMGELQEFLRLNQGVLRHLVVILPDTYTPPTIAEIEAGLDAFYETKREARAKKMQRPEPSSRTPFPRKQAELVVAEKPVEKKVEAHVPKASVATETLEVSHKAAPAKAHVEPVKAAPVAPKEPAYTEPKNAVSKDAKLDEKLKSIFDDELSF